MAMARERWTSSPYQVTWRPGWTSEAGRAPAMKRAVSTIVEAGIVVSVKAHSGVLSATWARSSSRPTAFFST